MADKPQEKQTITIRTMKAEDVPNVVACQKAAYAGVLPDSLSDKRNYNMQIAAFPDGQFVAEQAGRIVGYACSLIVLLDDDAPWHSYDEITGVGTFSTHDPSGDTLYGADIAVHPEARGQGIAAKLYDQRRALLKRFNLRRMIAGGRIPGYAQYAGRLSPEQYVDAVKQGKLKDQALSVHLRAGYDVRAVHYGYLTDLESMNYATFLEMLNPDFDQAKRQIAASPIRKPVRKIRVCAAQYQLRSIKTWQDFERQVEFFVETADEYHCHFLLFPELASAQLFSTMSPEIEALEAVKLLAELHGQYEDLFKRMATEYGLTIIGGSHPKEVEGELRNVAHLFTPTGKVYTQEKLHITPGERRWWGMYPGDTLKVFDTPHGRIGILICYDVEFPELARLLTLHGIEVLFVPFATDERKSYQRVRYCAQARAVENMIYVVTAGCVGNLPQVRSFLVNYGQAAVLTPCDIAFPKDGIAAEADPNSETVVIAELDLNDLATQRDLGSVRPLHDRRADLYSLSMKTPIEIVRVE